MKLHELGLNEAGQLLAGGAVSAVELARVALERIEALDGALNAFISTRPEEALQAAAAADERRRRGAPLSAIDGVPLAVKDIFNLKGARTTCASRMLENYVSPYDATTMEKLQAAGAVIVGKTNLDEFAMGSSCENSAFGPTLNPWDRERVAGGSSGGSAAAVAAGMVPAALGTDSGGSVRLPAAFCGIVGLKPTYGRVSRYGVVAYASSLDVVGPMARSVADVATLLQVIAGLDPRDSTTSPMPVPDYAAGLQGELRGLRVGVPRQYLTNGIQPGVEAAVRGAIAQMGQLGAEVREVSLPHTRYGVAAFYIIAPAEASANLARYDGVRYGVKVEKEDLWASLYATRGQGFGAEVKRRIMLGTYALSSGYYDAYYLKAQQVRTLIKRDFEEAFQQVDILLCPTSPTVAFRLGERSEDLIAMYLSDVYTVTANEAGLPALSLPCGLAEGLPVGLQLIGRPFAEQQLLQAAYAYEQANSWRLLRPPVEGRQPGAPA